MTEHKTPIEQAFDLFFYAPLGFMFHAQEIVEELVEKGHQQVVAARMFGQFAVEGQGPKLIGDLQKRIEGITEQFTGQFTGRSAKPAPAATNGPVAAATQTSAPVEPPPPTHGPAAEGLAIPDYDSLSASQVVPRLEGLSDGELAAVRDYESEHRGRKTILNKIAQLQG